MRIYFIRHGETDWNKEGKLQGRTNIPLNENGRYVAELTRDALKDVRFDVAFTSPLDRAKETAEIILQGRDIEIIEEERIAEVCFGKYEGAKKNKADENIENFFKRPEKYIAPEGGESLKTVLARETQFLEELFYNEEYKDSTILVSTHGAALSGLLCVIKGYSAADFWKDGLHKNCGISIVDVVNGRALIVKEAIVLYDESALS